MGWVAVCFSLLLNLLLPMSPALAQGNGGAASLPLLTVEMLQQRLSTLDQRDGKPTIDLRQVAIDLRADSDLRDRFYRLVQNKLQSGSRPIGLDLSYSLVLGELDLTKLGLRAPLYGDALVPLLDTETQAQLSRDRKRLNQLNQLSRSLLIQEKSTAQQIYLIRGPLVFVQTHFTGNVVGADIFFLDRLLFQGTQFDQSLSLPGARFGQNVNLTGARFSQEVNLRNSIFFKNARLDQSYFAGVVTFQGTEFKRDANFNQSTFIKEANFSRVQWLDNADFAQTVWKEPVSFFKGSFDKALFFTQARIEAPLSMRQVRFSEPINFRNVALSAQADFGDAVFQERAYINVSGLDFNPDQARILGNPGQIGKVFSVPSLSGNETLLRNLVRNFRRLEQISDAYRVEYTAERLRLRELRQRLLGTNVNTAPQLKLVQIGFTEAQAQAIASRRKVHPLLSVSDLLDIEGIDLAAYVKVRDRILTRRPLSPLGRVQLCLRWLWLDGLVVLSRYGTGVGLIIGIGLMAVAWFAVLFWFIDRYRRRLPTPIVPPLAQALWIGVSFFACASIGLSMVLRSADYPAPILIWLAVLMLPLPLACIARILQKGRFHDLMEESYLREDGSMRQLRLLITRLPVIPLFPFFRDRFTPILQDRRWSWLNYYDFSLNNWFKFGFNDIRLRDQDVPGLITVLVWYQWGLGLMYVALLLWTFSRTIPGLNLLLYF
ncbi:pentapeptide repeat-containing protein [Pseudanabaena sp. FACHB-2040]|uniref:pentapeptide repeat-containing protein n=1 Tax=Pseudanabaena sp. FACHB-2040 TaxID=2692859 RepID=UPI0016875970|nr:pentapeptide repeat-containing protein [Pseudanabaena sp. FACHB-2040]MBD2256959.1 pentapeptide repeat-containing protein [Pseudanabaena sp. FACHB-2040]